MTTYFASLFFRSFTSRAAILLTGAALAFGCGNSVEDTNPGTPGAGGSGGQNAGGNSNAGGNPNEGGNANAGGHGGEACAGPGDPCIDDGFDGNCCGGLWCIVDSCVIPDGEGGGGPTCRTSADCSADEFCDFPENDCGASDAGTCAPRPTVCSDDHPQRCGCDGRVYEGNCDAEMAGSDVSVAGGCTPPDGYFACGDKLCEIGVEYCLQDSQWYPRPTTYTCEQIAEECLVEGVDQCECIYPPNDCEDRGCNVIPSGGLKISCDTV